MNRPSPLHSVVAMGVAVALTLASACASTSAHRVPADRASRRVADINQQILTICAATDWIKSLETCDALKTQIAKVGVALGPGPHSQKVPSQRRGDEARLELTRFLVLVEANRADSSIHQNAFAILDPLARDLRRGFAAPARAPLRYDSLSGTYTVSVLDDRGRQRPMEVVAGNQATPTLTLVQRDSGSMMHYEYTLSVNPRSAQPLAWLRIPCSWGGGTAALSGGVSQRAGDWGDETYCSFEVNLRPGEGPVSLKFRSRSTAGLGWAYAVSLSPEPVWPPGTTEGERLDVIETVDRLRGRWPTGMVTRVRTLVPSYDLRSLAETLEGVRAITRELTALCAETDWIAEGPTCGELAQGVEAARRAVYNPYFTDEGGSASHQAGARAALDALAAQLRAGRGSTIAEPAYMVLSQMVRAALLGVNEL